MIAVADHFEPSIVPGRGQERAPYDLQEQRLEKWCGRYPQVVDPWRDHDGRPFVHSYFYPAEQYDRGLVQRIADHCLSGFGELEIHLHHSRDTAENARIQLTEFRDALAFEHHCLSYMDDSPIPRYAFVHGNFGLANSAGDQVCGVDSEIEILAQTGCYADMTLPTGTFHRAQTGKINSLYECTLPLSTRAAHRTGRDLRAGSAPKTFPVMVQGPLLLDFSGSRQIGVENGAITARNPASMRRLGLWKKAAIAVEGRPDWLFIKLHCHGMDPTQENVMLGEPMKQFLRELMETADSRRHLVHFVSAREMTNILLAACDGREGNPAEYRDYRLKRVRQIAPPKTEPAMTSQVLQKG